MNGSIPDLPPAYTEIELSDLIPRKPVSALRDVMDSSINIEETVKIKKVNTRNEISNNRDILVRISFELLFRLPFALFSFSWVFTTFFLFLTLLVPPVGIPVSFMLLYSYRGLAICDVLFNKMILKMICKRNNKELDEKYDVVPRLSVFTEESPLHLLNRLEILWNDSFTRKSIIYILFVQFLMAFFIFIESVVLLAVLSFPPVWWFMEPWIFCLNVIQKSAAKVSFNALTV